MIPLNPQYEAIFDPRNIDEDCNKIAEEINDVTRMQMYEKSWEIYSKIYVAWLLSFALPMR